MKEQVKKKSSEFPRDSNKMTVTEIEEIEIIMEPCEETSINQNLEIESLQEVQPNDDMVETVYKTIENTMVPKLQKMYIPSWSALNAVISEQPVTTRTKKLYFPSIPGPSSDYSAIYAALKLSQGISTYTIGGEKTVVTLALDLDLFEREYLLLHTRGDLKNKFILRLGELHIIFAHLRTIGQCGIARCWLEADCMGSVTVEQVLNCGHMKRAVNIHKATLISLYSILMRDFRIEHPWIFCGPSGKLYDLVNKINDACKGKNWSIVHDSCY